MSRTKGHRGSKHVYWKHQTSHSSNKKNKVDSHKRQRCAQRNVMNDIDNIVEWDATIIPDYNRKKGGGTYGWKSGVYNWYKQ